jgi:hypothetical protein
MQILLYAVIAVLIIWRVVYRQVQGSIITTQGVVLIPGILLLLGLVNCAQALPRSSGTEIALTGADLVVLLLLGVARAATTKISTRDGYAFQKGGVPTLVLWLVTIAIRVGFAVVGARIGAAGALTTASVLLSMGLSIGVQNALVLARARRAGLRVATRRSDVVTARR